MHGYCLSFPFFGKIWRWFLYVVVLITVVSADCSGPSTCSIRDHVTTKHIYRTFTANGFANCILECYNDTNCSSYNYEYQPNDWSGHICQLSRCWTNESLVGKPRFWFQQLPVRQWQNEELCRKPESFDGLELSEILQSRKDPNYFKVLMKYLGDKKGRVWKRCFHSDKPGLNASSFHSLCDSKGPTVTIARVDKYVFGGYMDKSWESSNECRTVWSNQSFLFSLYNVDGFKPHIFPIQNHTNAALLCSETGPLFGRGDLGLSLPPLGVSVTGCRDYAQPPNCTCPAIHLKDACPFYTGQKAFNTTDVEVFYEKY